MKIAHFAQVAPNRCGLYGTCKDLITAERLNGLDAGCVNTYMAQPNTVITGGLIQELKPVKDDTLAPMSYEWAKTADVMIRHSMIPTPLQNIGKPLVMALHGRPESSYRLEMGGNKIINTLARRARDDRYKAFMIFWKEYMLPWSTLIPSEKMFYIPAPVDLDFYNPVGERFDLKEKSGNPNILIADIWREDVTPFNVLMAAVLFREKYCKTARIHILAMQGRNYKTMAPILVGIKNSGALGALSGLTNQVVKFYRAADIVVTPHTIATRTVREPLACGVPVVAGHGNRYTPYKASHMDIEAFARAINECWQDYKSDPKAVKEMARKTAEIAFNPVNTGKVIKEVFEAL